MNVAKNIKTFRENQNLTQEEFAEKLGMSKNGYAKLERGESKINVEHLQQIANVFNIDIADLLKENRDLNLLIGNNYTNFLNNYNSKHEIEKLELIIAHKDEIIAQKDKEIELLRKLLEK